MKKILLLIILALSLVDLALAFVDHGDQTVSDAATGLMWDQRETTAMSWTAALSYCENLSHATYTDWRLPNRNELQSLVDHAKTTAPTINTGYFPSAFSHIYWASTSYAQNTSSAWNVNFSNGYVGYSISKTYTHYVRCVR